MYEGGAPGRITPWWCQLIHHESTAAELVLDLVALQPCPADPVACSPDRPFTLRTTRPNADATMHDRSEVSASATDVVSVVHGTTDAGPPPVTRSAGKRG
jgi:hypothetical protein